MREPVGDRNKSAHSSCAGLGTTSVGRYPNSERTEPRSKSIITGRSSAPTTPIASRSLPSRPFAETSADWDAAERPKRNRSIPASSTKTNAAGIPACVAVRNAVTIPRASTSSIRPVRRTPAGRGIRFDRVLSHTRGDRRPPTIPASRHRAGCSICPSKETRILLFSTLVHPSEFPLRYREAGLTECGPTRSDGKSSMRKIEGLPPVAETVPKISSTITGARCSTSSSVRSSGWALRRQGHRPQEVLCLMRALAVLLIAAGAVAGQKRQFSVVEASIPEMQAALKSRRVTSRELLTAVPDPHCNV